MKIRLIFKEVDPIETTLESIFAGNLPFTRQNPTVCGYDLFFVTAKDGTDIFSGDKVLVRGTKRVGDYETEVILNMYGWPQLKENKTYLIDPYTHAAVLSKI